MKECDDELFRVYLRPYALVSVGSAFWLSAEAVNVHLKHGQGQISMINKTNAFSPSSSLNPLGHYDVYYHFLDDIDRVTQVMLISS